jgi:hypothetical protein
MAGFTIDTSRLAKCVVDLTKVPEGVFDFSGLEGYQPGKSVVVVTWFPPELIRQRGLPPEAICGIVPSADSGIDAEVFLQNGHFVETLHRLNAAYPDPELVEFVRTTNAPGVAVIDERSPDVNADIPSEDILGHYSLKKGALSAYHENENYRLVTEDGVFKLNPWLRKLLVEIVINGKSLRNWNLPRR